MSSEKPTEATAATTAEPSSAAVAATSSEKDAPALCAACDRCRARKTKCDGKRPCSNCAAKYMKRNKIGSIDGVDPNLVECIYSPAKRRGPVPGRSGGQSRKFDEVDASRSSNGNGAIAAAAGIGGGGDRSSVAKMNANLMRMDLGVGDLNILEALSGLGNATGNDHQANLLKQQAQLSALMNVNGSNGTNGSNDGNNNLLSMQQQLWIQQQLALQNAGFGSWLQMMPQLNQNLPGAANFGANFPGGQPRQQLSQLQQKPSSDSMSQQQQIMLLQQQVQNLQKQNNQSSSSASEKEGPKAQRQKIDHATELDPVNSPKSVSKYLPLLAKSSVDGNRLRSYYYLAMDNLFNLPPIPSDEEYCAKLEIAVTPSILPPFDIAALRAARFSELALGAIINNQITLALELSNATVTCLRQCIEEPIHPSCMFEVARAYFLHGMFRSYRADFTRYFKYRRVALTQISQMEDNVQGCEALIAAMSFHDGFLYSAFYANLDNTPDIDSDIPMVQQIAGNKYYSPVETKFKTATSIKRIAANPINQTWMQGAPPVFLNNEAPPLSRCLDAISCAVRNCCDLANNSSENMGTCKLTATGLAISDHENELCSKNLVLSAYALLQQHESNPLNIDKNIGYHLVISAMDAFLEAGDPKNANQGLTDAQIQNLLFVCNTALENPLLLYQAGCSYHMVTNAAILLCYLMNELVTKKADIESNHTTRAAIEALFNEVSDTYTSIKKLLASHRRKLPVRLRCHGLPRPLSGEKANEMFVDLSEVRMCSFRSCQGFVLMGCSPCVAAERAKLAKEQFESESEMEFNDIEAVYKNELDMLEQELDLDDDSLLNELSKMISN